jgi:ABC-type amino acid transport substrate-binding protein
MLNQEMERRDFMKWALLAGGTAAAMSINPKNLYLNFRFKDSYRKNEIIANMQLIEDQVKEVHFPPAEPNPVKLGSNQSRLDRIKQRGIMRVGYNPDQLPFSYRNPKGELVGFDVDLVHKLAFDLNVALEFVSFEWPSLEKNLKEDYFDFAISGITATMERSEKILFSDGYMMVTMGLVVEEHRRKDFSTIDSIRNQDHVRIGVVEDGLIFTKRFYELIENNEVIKLPSEKMFFESNDMNLDALITTAEGGAAWTLIFPHYALVIPVSKPRKVPLVLGLAQHDTKFEDFLNNWIRLKRLDGTIDELKDHWIYGRTAVKAGPRWSIIRNVLHWIE